MPNAALAHEIARARRQRLENTLAFQTRAAGLPEPAREVRLIPSRRWRYDFVWPRARLIVEVEGGVWTQGRHVRPDGFTGDCEKYNAASILGYNILRYTGGMVENGAAIRDIETYLQQLGGRLDEEAAGRNERTSLGAQSHQPTPLGP